MLSFLVSVTTFVAMQLLAHKRIEGFYVGVVSQVLWVWLIVVTGQWGLFLLTGAMLVTYVQGIRNWKRGVGRD